MRNKKILLTSFFLLAIFIMSVYTTTTTTADLTVKNASSYTITSSYNPINLRCLIEVPEYYDLNSNIGFVVAGYREDKCAFVELNNLNNLTVKMYPTGREDITLASLTEKTMTRVEKLYIGSFPPLIIAGSYTLKATITYNDPYLASPITVTSTKAFNIGQWKNITKIAESWFDDACYSLQNSEENIMHFANTNDNMLSALLVYKSVSDLYSILPNMASLPPIFNITVIKIDGYASDIGYTMDDAEEQINASISLLNLKAEYDLRYIRDIDEFMAFITAERVIAHKNIIINLHGSYIPIKVPYDYSIFFRKMRNTTTLNKWTWVHVGGDRPFSYLYTSTDETINMSFLGFAGMLYGMGLIDQHPYFFNSLERLKVPQDPFYTDLSHENLVSLDLEDLNVLPLDRYWCSLNLYPPYTDRFNDYTRNPLRSPSYPPSIGTIILYNKDRWNSDPAKNPPSGYEQYTYNGGSTELGWFETIDSVDVSVCIHNPITFQQFPDDVYLDVYVRVYDGSWQSWEKVGRICKANFSDYHDYFAITTGLDLDSDLLCDLIPPHIPLTFRFRVNSERGYMADINFVHNAYWVQAPETRILEEFVSPYRIQHIADWAKGYEQLKASNYLHFSIVDGAFYLSRDTPLFALEDSINTGYYHTEIHGYSDPNILYKPTYSMFSADIPSVYQKNDSWVLGSAARGEASFVSTGGDKLFVGQTSPTNNFIFSVLPLNYTMPLLFGYIFTRFVEGCKAIMSKLDNLIWNLPYEHQDLLSTTRYIKNNISRGINDYDFTKVVHYLYMLANFTLILHNTFKDPLAALIDFNLHLTVNLSQYLTPVLDGIQEINQSISAILGTNFSLALTNALTSLQMGQVFTDVFGMFGYALGQALWALDPISGVLYAFETIFPDASIILATVRTVLNPLSWVIIGVQQIIEQVFEEWGEEVWGAIETALIGFFNVIGDFLTGIMETVMHGFNTIVKVFSETIEQVVTTLERMINEGIESVIDIIRSVAIQIHETIYNIVGWLLDTKQQILTFVVDAIAMVKTFVIKTIADIQGAITVFQQYINSMYINLQKAVAFIPEIANTIFTTIKGVAERTGWLSYLLDWAGVKLPEHFTLQSEIAYLLSITRQADTGVYLLVINPSVISTESVYFVALQDGNLHDLSMLNISMHNSHTYRDLQYSRLGVGIYKLEMEQIIPDTYTVIAEFAGSEESKMVSFMDVYSPLDITWGGIYPQFQVSYPSNFYTTVDNIITLQLNNPSYRRANLRVNVKIVDTFTGAVALDQDFGGYVGAETTTTLRYAVVPAWYSVFIIGNFKLKIEIVELDGDFRETGVSWLVTYNVTMSWGFGSIGIYALLVIPYIFSGHSLLKPLYKKVKMSTKKRRFTSK